MYDSYQIWMATRFCVILQHLCHGAGAVWTSQMSEIDRSSEATRWVSSFRSWLHRLVLGMSVAYRQDFFMGQWLRLNMGDPIWIHLGSLHKGEDDDQWLDGMGYCMYMYVLHCTTLFEKTHPQNEKLFGRLNAGHSQLFKVIELEDTAHSAVGGGPSAASCSWGIPRMGGFSSHPIFFIARWRQRFGQLWWSSGLCHTVVSTSLKLREPHWVLQHLADVSAATSYKLLLVDLQLKLFGHESGFSQTFPDFHATPLRFFTLCFITRFSTWGQALTSQPNSTAVVLSQGLQACNSSRSVQPVEHAERSIPSHRRSLNWTADGQQTCNDMPPGWQFQRKWWESKSIGCFSIFRHSL